MKARFCITWLGLLCASFVSLTPAVAADIVLDNGEHGTSATGRWLSSAGTSPYNGGSLYSNQAGASYRFALTVPAPGSYRAWMWWSGYASRPSSARVEIQHQSGAASVQVNQQEGVGRWNELGTWSFDATAAITIFAASTGSTCADAVLLTGDGVSPPPYEEVLDNGQVGTVAVGYWPISGGADPYGTSSLYSRDGASSYYRYTFVVPSPGAYRVSLWWTDYPSRSNRVRVVVAAQPQGQYTTVYVDQRTGGSRWNSIGVFDLTYSADVVIWSSGSGTSTCADAVMLEALPIGPVDIIVDNGEAGTSSTGSWPLSGGSQPYGPTSLYSKQAGATYSYTVDLPVAGDYEVFLWWSGYPSRPPSVEVEIHTATFATTRWVDQRSSVGQWNPVFNFTLTGTVTIKLISQGNGSACADAVRFLRKS